MFATHAAITLIPVLILGLVLAAGYRSEARQRGLAVGKSEALLVAQTAVEPILDGRPLSAGLTPAQATELQRLVAHAVGGRDILRMRLRDLSGRVVFSDDGSGFKEKPEDEALGARSASTGAIDRVFESVVGATLVSLGGFLLWQLGRDRGRYRYAGRIRVMVGVIRRGWSRARRRGAVAAGPRDELSSRSAFAVGVLHGTGAETPTQVVLFASAAISGSKAASALLLLSFVSGMILADLGIAASWLAGVFGARSAPRAQIVLGGLTGLSSLGVGSLFLVGRSAVLPALFGG